MVVVVRVSASAPPSPLHRSGVFALRGESESAAGGIRPPFVLYLPSALPHRLFVRRQPASNTRFLRLLYLDDLQHAKNCGSCIRCAIEARDAVSSPPPIVLSTPPAAALEKK